MSPLYPYAAHHAAHRSPSLPARSSLPTRFLRCRFVRSLILAANASFLALGTSPTQATTFLVTPGSSIQAAIDSASDGDLIEIQSGTYLESLTVNKSVTVTGVDTGTGQPVIDASETTAPCAVRVESDGVELSHLTILGGQPFQIELLGDHPKLESLSIIDLEEAEFRETPAVIGRSLSGLEVSECTFRVFGSALTLFEPKDFRIVDNHIEGRDTYSIVLVSAGADTPITNGVIARNSILQQGGGGINVRALLSTGLAVNLAIEDNTISGSNGSIGLFVASEGVGIRRNSLIQGDGPGSGIYGIMVYGTSGVAVEDNHASGLKVELAYRFESCSGLTVTGNSAEGNEDTGMGLIAVTNSEFSGNLMNGNRYNFWVAPFVMDPGLLPGNQINQTNRVDDKPVWYLEGVDDLCFDGSENVGTLVLYGCRNATVRNLVGSSNGAGVMGTRCENLTIATCDFQGMYNGIVALNCPALSVTGNHLRGCFEALKFGNFQHGLIAKNHMEDSGDGGILAGGLMQDVTVKDNHIRGAAGGIYLDHVIGKNTVFENNSVQQTYRVGLSATGSLNVTLRENAFEPATGVGMELATSTLCTLSQNSVGGAAETSLLLSDSPRNRIHGNHMVSSMIGVFLRRGTDEPGSFGNFLYNNYVNSQTPVVFYASTNPGSEAVDRFNRRPVSPAVTVIQGVLVSTEDLPVLDPIVLDPNPPANTWNIRKTAGENIVGGPYVGGNYWASPAGTGFSEIQLDRGDGFCPEPFVIAANNVDAVPLHLPMTVAIQELIDTVLGYHLRRGIEKSFVEKLTAAYRLLLKPAPVPARNLLEAVIKEARAQQSKALTAAQSRELVQSAQWILSQLVIR